jgi:uncharacterized protein (TIGR03083 family)
MDYCEIYRNERRRVAELVRSATWDQLERRVPACPAWTGTELLAHLVGIAADVAIGDIDGVGTPPWTQRQVEARRGRTVEGLLDEWEVAGAQAEVRIEEMPPLLQAVMNADLAIHEQDFRGLMNQPGGRDTEAYTSARETIYRALDRRVRKAELPSLRISTEQGELFLPAIQNGGAPGATVTGSDFELSRAAVGRRSLSQIAAFAWEGDRAPYLPIFSGFPLPAQDLLEE